MSDIFLKNKKNNKNISDFLQTDTVSTLNLPEWISLVDIPNKNEKSIDSEFDTSTADLEMKLKNIFKNSQNGGGEMVDLVLNGKKKSNHNLMSVTKKVSKKNSKLVGEKKTSSKKLVGGNKKTSSKKLTAKKTSSKKLVGGSKKLTGKKTSKKLVGGTKKTSKKLVGGTKKTSKKLTGKKTSKKTSKKLEGGGSCHKKKSSKKKSSKKMSKKKSKKMSKKKVSKKKSKRSKKKKSKKSSKKMSKKKSKKTSKKAKRAAAPHLALVQKLLKLIKEKEGINHPQAMKKMKDYMTKALGKSYEQAKAEGMTYMDALNKTINSM